MASFSKALSDTELNDLGQNVIRPDLAIVRGADERTVFLKLRELRNKW